MCMTRTSEQKNCMLESIHLTTLAFTENAVELHSLVYNYFIFLTPAYNNELFYYMFYFFSRSSARDACVRTFLHTLSQAFVNNVDR